MSKAGIGLAALIAGSSWIFAGEGKKSDASVKHQVEDVSVDEMVNKKVAAIQQQGMTPIMCVGETLQEREAGDTESKVIGQVRAGLANRKPAQIASLVIAYEPIWALSLIHISEPTRPY